MKAQYDAIIIPPEFYELIYDICIRYYFLFNRIPNDEKSNRLFIECYHAIQSIESRFRKDDGDAKKLNGDKRYYLHLAIETLVQYGDLSMADEIKKLETFLNNQGL